MRLSIILSVPGIWPQRIKRFVRGNSVNAALGGIITTYFDWLKRQGIKLYEQNGIYWRQYRGALIPASIGPVIANINIEDGKKLLSMSGGWFIRCTAPAVTSEKNWWYIVCDKYSRAELSGNTKSKINRGNRNCSVRRISAEWAASQGFACYANAYKRYDAAKPVSKEQFQKSITETIEGPFEYWGVFYKEQLAGYCQCVHDGNWVGTSVIKFDPDYLKYYSSYALFDNLLTYYVMQQGMIVCNGSRSVSHDTNMQEYLLNFGFERKYCTLQLVYRDILKLAVNGAYPFRKFFRGLPWYPWRNAITSLLFLEEINRNGGENLGY